MRALKLPIDLPSLRRAFARRPALAALATERAVGDLGKRLGHDFAPGATAPPVKLSQPHSSRSSPGTTRRRSTGRRRAERARPAGVTAKSSPGSTRTGIRRHPRGGCGAPAGQGTPRSTPSRVEDLSNRGRSRHRSGTARARAAALGSVPRGATASRRPPTTESCPRSPPPQVDSFTNLVAARDEEDRIAATIAALREAFPDADVIVGTTGRATGTARVAEQAGARVLSLPAQRKGSGTRVRRAGGSARRPPSQRRGSQRRSAAAPRGGRRPGRGRICRNAGAAASGSSSARRRELVRLAAGRELREPLSRATARSRRGRGERCFPTAAGFGCEARMTWMRSRPGWRSRRSSCRFAIGQPVATSPGSCTAPASCATSCSPSAPWPRNHRGLRLPLVAGRSACSSAGGAVVGRSPRRRSARRPGAGVCRPPARGTHNGCAQARRDPAGRPAGDAAALRRAPRRPCRERAHPLDTRPGRAAEGVHAGGVSLSGHHFCPPS